MLKKLSFIFVKNEVTASTQSNTSFRDIFACTYDRYFNQETEAGRKNRNWFKLILGIQFALSVSIFALSIFNGITFASVPNKDFVTTWNTFWSLGLFALVVLGASSIAETLARRKLQLRIYTAEVIQFIEKSFDPKLIAYVSAVMARENVDNPPGRMQEAISAYIEGVIRIAANLTGMAMSALSLIGVIFMAHYSGVVWVPAAIIFMCYFVATSASGISWMIGHFLKIKERDKQAQFQNESIRRDGIAGFDYADDIARSYNPEWKDRLIALQKKIFTTQDVINESYALIAIPEQITNGTAAFVIPFIWIVGIIQVYGIDSNLYGDSSWPAQMLMNAFNLSGLVESGLSTKAGYERKVQMENALAIAETEAAKPLGISGLFSRNSDLLLKNINIKVPFDPDNKTLITGDDFHIRQGEWIAVDGRDGFAVILFLDKMLQALLQGGHEKKINALFYSGDPPLPQSMKTRDEWYNLKELLTYMSSSKDIDDERCRFALRQAGLDSFADRLNETSDIYGTPWIKRLTREEKEALAIARLFLVDVAQTPVDFLILSRVPEKNRKQILQNIKNYMPKTTVLTLWHSDDLSEHHTARLDIAANDNQRGSTPVFNVRLRQIRTASL